MNLSQFFDYSQEVMKKAGFSEKEMLEENISFYNKLQDMPLMNIFGKGKINRDKLIDDFDKIKK